MLVHSNKKQIKHNEKNIKIYFVINFDCINIFHTASLISDVSICIPICCATERSTKRRFEGRIGEEVEIEFLLGSGCIDV
jgi:hypothetical protein